MERVDRSWRAVRAIFQGVACETWAATVVTVAFAGGHAYGGIGYTDQASWMAAQGGADAATFSSFETSDAPLGYFSMDRWGYWEDRGIRFDEIYGGLGVVAGNEFNYGYNLAEAWGVDPADHALRAWGDEIRVELTRPATAFALEFASIYPSLNVKYYYASGIGGSHYFTGPPSVAYPPHFYGVVGTEPIVRVTLVVGGTSANGVNIRSYIKSFSLGTPIPAPSTGLLLLGGLIGRSRRRRTE